MWATKLIENLKMNTQLHLSQQTHISRDTCVCQQLVVGCVRPEQLPGHFKFRHSSSLQVTFYTLHIPKVYSNLEVIQAMSWCVLLPLRENLFQYICSLQCHRRLQFGDIAANIVWTYLWDQLCSVQTLHLECSCDNFWRTTVHYHYSARVDFSLHRYERQLQLERKNVWKSWSSQNLGISWNSWEKIWS